MFTFILLVVLVVIFLVLLAITAEHGEKKAEQAYTNGRKDCGDEWTIEFEALKTKKEQDIKDLREFKNGEIDSLREFKGKEIEKLNTDHAATIESLETAIEIKNTAIINQRGTISAKDAIITKLASYLQHPFAQFIINHTVHKEGAEISAEELKAVYEKTTGKTITAIRMGQFLHFMQFASKEKKGRSYWQGIAFKGAE